MSMSSGVIVTLEDRIHALCRDFKANVHNYLDDGDRVSGMCEGITADFCHLFREELYATPLHLLGHRSNYPNRSKNHQHQPSPDPRFYHVICQFPEEQLTLDLTYRQLDRQSTLYYHIQPLAAVHAEWLVVAPDWEMVNTFLDVGIHLGQATYKWQRQTYPNMPDDAILIEMARQKSLAQTAYATTLRYMEAGQLHFTGAFEDNGQLRLLQANWPQQLTDNKKE